MILLNGLLTYGRIFKILLHHTNVIGSIRLPNSSPVMLPIVGKSTPPIVYKLLLMEEIRLNSWYGESTTIYAGFYTSEVVIARFLVYQDNKPNRGRMFLFVSSPAGVSSSERRVRFQFVFKIWRTLPETYMAPENPWWEDEFPSGKVYVIGGHINHWWPY